MIFLPGREKKDGESKRRRDGEGDELKEEEKEERRKHDGDVERGIGYKCKMASGRTPKKFGGGTGVRRPGTAARV